MNTHLFPLLQSYNERACRGTSNSDSGSHRRPQVAVSDFNFAISCRSRHVEKCATADVRRRRRAATGPWKRYVNVPAHEIDPSCPSPFSLSRGEIGLRFPPTVLPLCENTFALIAVVPERSSAQSPNRRTAAVGGALGSITWAFQVHAASRVASAPSGGAVAMDGMATLGNLRGSGSFDRGDVGGSNN